MNIVPLFILALLGIPVPFKRIFGRDLPEGEFGRMLEGDPEMPPTFVSGFWSFLNPIRNAILSMFWWRTWSVLDIGVIPMGPIYLMYGDGAVLPKQIRTQFIAVRHGFEACRFIIASSQGLEIAFSVVARGTREDITHAIGEYLLDRRGLKPEQFLPDVGLHITFV